VTFRIDSVQLESFRNRKRLTIEPGEDLTIVIGPNAAGKTNVVEAIQLLTAGESFRRPEWSELVRWGDDGAKVSLTAHGEDRRRDVELTVSSEGARRFIVNGVEKRRIADVAGTIPSVLFTPDDLGLVKESAERRRDEIDGLGAQLSKTYRDIRAQYDKALRQRNAILRDERADEALLEAWTERLVSLGSALFLHRIRLFGRLRGPLAEAYGDVADYEVLEAQYRSAWWTSDEPPTDRHQAEEALAAAIESRRAEETARRLTLMGPHRDDVVFLVDGHDARSFASQGQQRTIALAWKMAEVSVVQAVTGSQPVLLLDDVMSELDESRRDALSRAVLGRAQTFVTTTNLGYFDDELIKRATLVRLDG